MEKKFYIGISDILIKYTTKHNQNTVDQTISSTLKKCFFLYILTLQTNLHINNYNPAHIDLKTKISIKCIE